MQLSSRVTLKFSGRDGLPSDSIKILNLPENGRITMAEAETITGMTTTTLNLGSVSLLSNQSMGEFYEEYLKHPQYFYCII